MKESYRSKLALPTEIEIEVCFSVLVDENAVDRFVESIQKPSWYKNYRSKSQDIRSFLLGHAMFANEFTTVVVPNNRQNRIERISLWKCACCYS